MTNDVILTQRDHDQVCQLLRQLIDHCRALDHVKRIEDPLKYSGEGFLTNKLKLIKETLENGSK